MSLKKLGLGIIVCSLIVPVTLTGCIQKTEERIEVQDVDPAPVVVPDRDVDIKIQTDQAK